MEIAERNGRDLLIKAYESIQHLFDDLECNRKLNWRAFRNLHTEPINDRNICFYLAAIESCVHQQLPIIRMNRKMGRVGHGPVDETTISWRMDHRQHDHPTASTMFDEISVMGSTNLHLNRVMNLVPTIPT